MYFPYSQRSPQMLTFTGNLMANVVGFLEGCGWVKSISGNYTYLSCTSPQGITSKVRIWYDSSWQGNFVKFTFGNTSQGYTYIIASSEKTYQIIGNQCQFFLSVPGVSAHQMGTTVCGGVPYVPPANVLEECWWSTGDSTNIYGFPGDSFRFGLLTSSFKSGSYSYSREAYYDGHLTQGSGVGGLRLETFTSASSIFYSAQNAPSVYLNDTPIYIPSLLAWGSTLMGTPKVRGLIWDSLISTKSEVMDTIMIYDGNSWINFTDEFYFGGLYLLMPINATGGNYTY